MPSTNSAPLEALDIAERGAEIIALKRQGLTFREIGERLNVSKSQVHRSFHGAVRMIPVEEAARYREEQLRRIEMEREVAMDIVASSHVAVSNGMVVKLDGKTLEDTGPVLAALDRLIKLDDQEAKLLGLYAEQKVGMSDGLRIELVGVDLGDLT